MPTEVSTDKLKQMLARQKRAEAQYRAAMRKPLIEMLGIMNPGDPPPEKYEELVAYAFDFLMSEYREVNGVEVSALPARPESQGGLSLEE